MPQSMRAVVSNELSPLRDLVGTIIHQQGIHVLLVLDILPGRALTFINRELTPA